MTRVREPLVDSGFEVLHHLLVHGGQEVPLRLLVLSLSSHAGLLPLVVLDGLSPEPVLKLLLLGKLLLLPVFLIFQVQLVLDQVFVDGCLLSSEVRAFSLEVIWFGNEIGLHALFQSVISQLILLGIFERLVILNLFGQHPMKHLLVAKLRLELKELFSDSVLVALGSSVVRSVVQSEAFLGVELLEHLLIDLHLSLLLGQGVLILLDLLLMVSFLLLVLFKLRNRSLCLRHRAKVEHVVGTLRTLAVDVVG